MELQCVHRRLLHFVDWLLSLGLFKIECVKQSWRFLALLKAITGVWLWRKFRLSLLDKLNRSQYLFIVKPRFGSEMLYVTTNGIMFLALSFTSEFTKASSCVCDDIFWNAESMTFSGYCLLRKCPLSSSSDPWKLLSSDIIRRYRFAWLYGILSLHFLGWHEEKC